MPIAFDTTALGFSIENALLLARACEAANAPDEERVSAAATALGLTDAVEPFNLRVPDEGVDLRGFVGSVDDLAVLVFRETDSLDDWLRDTVLVQKPALGGLVHKGFADALDALWPIMKAALLAQLPGHDLWLAGHGVGGALAVLAAARLDEQGTNVEAVYTFGSPRVGNRDFFSAYRPLTYRLVNHNDVVAHVPAEDVLTGGYHYYAYKHVGTLKYFDRHGLLDEGTWDWRTKKDLLNEQLRRQGRPPTEWFQDHHLSNYLAALENNL